MDTPKKVHLIGNAHLDPVWLWRWEEGCAEVMATFQSALERMEDFDGYVFTCAGAQYYKWVEEMDPVMFKKIQQRVAEGRWRIVGGWWIQPDCNAPSGESFARHSLYSQRYYQRAFGVTCKTGYNVDSFGHNAMLPQILKLSGMDNYVYMRPMRDIEKKYDFPQNAFWWIGADGTRVKTYRIPAHVAHGGYATADPEGTVAKARELADRSGKDGIPEMCFYGVGNHGGGPTIATMNALEPILDGDIGYSSPDTYFASLKDDLPELKGELQHHASGCYSSVMEVKALNRKAEYRLQAAEAFELMARHAGVLTDRTDFAALWENVLFNQFHDIMGGCSIRAAYDDVREAFGESLNGASRAWNRAAQAITRQIDTGMGRPLGRNNRIDWRWNSVPGRGTPVTVFNPFSWPITSPIRTNARFTAITDENGRRLPTQRVRSGVTNGADDKHEDVFVAQVPPMGWRTYELYTGEAPCPPEPVEGTLEAGDSWMENDFLRVEFDPATGAMTRLFDKVSKEERLASPAGALVVDDTKNDTWAHGIFAFRDVVGSFGSAALKLTEKGDVMACLRVETRCEGSTLRQIYTLYRNQPGLQVDVKVFWQEKHRILKLSFPTGRAGDVTSSIPYGFLNRPQDGDEQPMGGWVRLGRFGLATDSRAAYDAQDGELRLTCLRSPIFADHFGVRDDQCEFSEQGESRFSYTLMAQADNESLSHEAARLTCPTEFLITTHHTGTLPASFSALSMEGNAEATVLKFAEDGNGMILRLHETRGETSPVKVCLYGAAWTDTLRPQEIATYRIQGGKATKVNILEENME